MEIKLFWLGMASFAFHPVSLQGSLIIIFCRKNHQYLQTGSSDLVFCCIEIIIKESQQIFTFCLVVAYCVSYPVRSKDYLINSETRKNHLISVIFCVKIIIKGRQDLVLPFLVGCGQVCLWANKIPGFFNHHYIQKEIINSFV